MYVNAAATGSAPILLSSRAMQARLNVLNRGLFPLQYMDLLKGEDVLQENLPPANGVKALPGKNLLKLVLRPANKQGINYEEVPKVESIKEVQEELQKTYPDLLKTAAEAMDIALPEHSPVKHPAVDVISQCGRQEMEIVFLGTGAAIPSKYRNVTATYLDLFDRGGLLMDCGEGTYGQLVRRYGQDGALDVVANLGLIWISHIHADHHAGLPMVLNKRQRQLGSGAAPILVIGPRPLKKVLEGYSQLEGLAYRFVDCACLVPNATQYEVPDLDDVKEELGLTRLECVRVVHCTQAFGLIIGSKSGWSLANSGDTRPCEELVCAAKDVTVLIHEATFEDALEEEARMKRHSLTREAIEVGQAANAYRTILSHFSQRYPKIPVVDPSFRDCTCIAFDLMTVNLADLPQLPRLVGPLRKFFEEMEKLSGDDDSPLTLLA
eukprot:jgi/Botrbrau1/4343/Bobra.0232s0032.1